MTTPPENPVSSTSISKTPTTALVSLIGKLVDELKVLDGEIDLGSHLAGSAITLRFHRTGEFSVEVDANSPHLQEDRLQAAIETLMKGPSDDDSDGPHSPGVADQP